MTTQADKELAEILEMPKEWVCDVPDCSVHHTTQLEALLEYLADRVLEGKLVEAERAEQVLREQGKAMFSLDIKDRIKELKAIKEGKR